MKEAKKHIKEIVQLYIKLNPGEFEDFKDGMKMVRATLKDEKFGSANAYTRALYEMPESLHEMLIMGLHEDEMVWLKAGGLNKKEGGLWFARTFKDFAIPNSI